MKIKVILLQFFLLAQSVFAGHGCPVPGCDTFYDVMFSAPGNAPCLKCESVGLKQCPASPTDMTESQWYHYFFKHGKLHNNLLTCPNYVYGLNKIRIKAGPQKPKTPPQESPAELLKKSAAAVREERLEIDRHLQDSYARSDEQTKKMREYYDNRFANMPKADPQLEKDLEKSRSRAQELKAEMMRERAEAFCFPAETAVVTWQGEKNIHNVSLIDWVLANDFINSQCVFSRVEEVYNQEVHELIEITLHGKSLRATLNHPLYVVEAGDFLPADQLSVGDHFLSLSGEAILIEDLNTLTLETPVQVYNLRVEGYHNYFVGEHHICAHNCDGFIEGAEESFKETLSGIKEAILHPLDTAKAVGDAVLHADEIAGRIAEKIASTIKEFPEYSDMQKGELVGKLTAELAAFLAPGATMKAGSYIAKLAVSTNLGEKVVEAMSLAAKEAGLAHEGVKNAWKAHPEKGSVGKAKFDGKYENPGHHDPRRGGPNNYNPSKSVLPENHKELWENSEFGLDGNRWTKEGSGKKAIYHRFDHDSNGNWHWTGSTNGMTKSGKSRAITLNIVPIELQRK